MRYSQLVNRSENKGRARRIIYLLSEKIKSLEDYILFKNEEIDFSEVEFQKYMGSVGGDEKPLERMLKKVHFSNGEFILLDGVFCPRSETEILVEALVEAMEDGANYIDICCGSGVIGISAMLRRPGISATLLDISESAIENTEQNLAKYGLEAKLVRGDWLKHLKAHNYEAISANFPYVGELDPIDENILKYDPETALFAENGGWYHYEKLLEHLETNGFWRLVVLECNPLHGQKWERIGQKYTQWSIEFKFDYNGRLRVAIIRRSVRS